MTDIFQALLNIKKYRHGDLNKILILNKKSRSAIIKVNSVGDALDHYIKDAFCNTFNEKNDKKKEEKYRLVFSHLGSQNNPPDIMIRGGDAIEVKKVNNLRVSKIALNSSYPKAKLKSSNLMITEECRNCEKWSEKDIIYIVGHVLKEKIRILIMVYGDCFAAKPDFYERTIENITKEIKSLELNLTNTKELARLNKIDPLQLTDLRVRGMFQVTSPLNYFSEFITINPKSSFSVFTIMRSTKFNSFDKDILTKIAKDYIIRDIEINDPDEPSKKIKAKLISLQI